jgi:hypothetical protein
MNELVSCSYFKTAPSVMSWLLSCICSGGPRPLVIGIAQAAAVPPGFMSTIVMDR